MFGNERHSVFNQLATISRNLAFPSNISLFLSVLGKTEREREREVHEHEQIRRWFLHKFSKLVLNTTANKSNKYKSTSVQKARNLLLFQQTHKQIKSQQFST